MRKNLLVFMLVVNSMLTMAGWENTLAPLGESKSIVLVKDGKANYRIIANGDSKAEIFLRDGLKVLTGVDFEGDAPLSIHFDKNRTGQGIDAYTIEVKDGNIILYAGNDNGIFNAVTALLEEDFGWRYYQKYQKAISPAGKITQANIVPRSYIPSFYQRMLYSDWAFDPAWATANKMRMGEYNRKYLVHTMPRFVTRKEFFTTHPEYFAIVDGSRDAPHADGQLCMTSLEVQKIIVKRALQAIEDTPGIEFLSISQGDNDDYCTCPACTELLKKEKHPSGPLIHFVNAVATEIGKIYPDVIITTLAYRYTMDAPTHVKPVKNVIIRFMTSNRINSYPFDFIKDTPDMKILNDWSRITNNRLLVWDHMTDFRHYLMPRADLPVLGENIRLFRDKKVFGVMLLTNFNNELGTQAAMRTWVCMKLLWNPDWDIEKLAEDYINGFFGDNIAPFMLKYNTLLINEWKQHHANNKPGVPFRFSRNFYTEASDLLKNAIVAADNNPLIVKALEFEELTLNYYLLEQWVTKKADISQYEKTIDRFSALLEKYSITEIVERNPNGVEKNINMYKDSIRLVEYISTFTDKRIILPATWSCYANHHNIQDIGIALIRDKESLVGRSLLQNPDNKWYVQWRLEDFPQFVKGEYKVRIRLRADKNASTGNGAIVGVQNILNKSAIIRHYIKSQDLEDKTFTWIDCGKFTKNSDLMLLYTSTIKNGAFKALYVDAVELIPEN